LIVYRGTIYDTQFKTKVAFVIPSETT